MRLHFSSIHCYLDSSSGPVLCTRELLELLASGGMECRELTASVLDYERETTLDEVLDGLDLPFQQFHAELDHGGWTDVIDLQGELLSHHSRTTKFASTLISSQLAGDLTEILSRVSASGGDIAQRIASVPAPRGDQPGRKR
jgi:hypothetical protein